METYKGPCSCRSLLKHCLPRILSLSLVMICKIVKLVHHPSQQYRKLKLSMNRLEQLWKPSIYTKANQIIGDGLPGRENIQMDSKTLLKTHSLSSTLC